MKTPISPPQTSRSTIAGAILLGGTLLIAHIWPGEAYPAEGLLVFVLLYLLGVLCYFSGRNIPPSQTNSQTVPYKSFLLFIFWSVLCTFLSEVPTEGYFGLGTLIGGATAYILIAWIMNLAHAANHDAPQLIKKWALIFFALLAVGYSIHAILEYHFLYDRSRRLLESQGLLETMPLAEGILYALDVKRVSSRFGNPNLLAAFLSMCAPLLLAILLQIKSRKVFLSLLPLTSGPLVYALILTRSAGGVLTFLLAAGLFLAICLFSRKASKVRIMQIILTFIIFAFLSLAVRHYTKPSSPPSQSIQTTQKQLPVRQIRTVQQRIYYWKSAFAIWKEKPLIGHGWDTYGVYYSQHRIKGAGETQYAHNFILQLLVETGLVGLLLFITFLAFLARRFIKNRSNLKPFDWALACACVAFLFNSLGDYSFYFRELFFDFCVLSGLAVSSSPAAESKQAPAKVYAIAVALLFAGFYFIALPAQKFMQHERIFKDILSEIDWLNRNSGSASDINQLRLQAMQMAEKAHKDTPGNPWGFQMLAQIQAMSGNLDQAIANQKKAVALYPGSAALAGDLAYYYWKAGNPVEADSWFKKSIRLHPLAGRFHARYAEFLSEQGRKNEALAQAGQAAELAMSENERAQYTVLLSRLQNTTGN